MERMGSSDNIDIVVQYDRSPQVIHTENRWEGTRRFHIQKSTDPDRITSPVISDMGKIDSGDPQTLIDFVAWAMSDYPASNYLLVISSHGTGWEDWHGYRSAVSPRRPLFRHTKLLATGVSASLVKIADHPVARAIANDDSSQDFLDNQELANVLN